MGKIYIPSIDKLISWADVVHRPSLPNPEKTDGFYFYEPGEPNYPATAKDSDIDPMVVQTYQTIQYAKDKILFKKEGKTHFDILWVWRRLP